MWLGSDGLVPAVNAAGNLLNDFAAGGVPDRNAKIVVVFHGDALTGILDDAHYLAKLGVHNPNVPVLSALKKHGVELYVCGQNLAAEKIDPKTLSPDVTLASDAWLVLSKPVSTRSECVAGRTVPRRSITRPSSRYTRPTPRGNIAQVALSRIPDSDCMKFAPVTSYRW